MKRQRGRKDPPAASHQELQLEEFLFGKNILATEHNKVTSKNSDKDDKKDAPSGAAPAWHDEDEDEMEVNLYSVDRLKKLRSNVDNSKENGIVSGSAFSTLLQERFQTKHLQWAEIKSTDDADDTSSILRSMDSMVDKSVSTSTGPIRAGKIDIVRQVDANISSPSKESITSLQFHSSGHLLLTGGLDKYLRFFHIDGDVNEKQLSVKFNDMSINAAKFRGNTSEVIVAGRKPYYYSYDTVSGHVSKIPGLMGKELKSYENLSVSPEGSKLAFAGQGGYVHIVSGTTKTWMMDCKMNTAVRSTAFLDETTIVTSGLDADVYIWDLRKSAKCLARFAHEDGTCSSSLCAWSANNNGSDDGTNPWCSYQFAVGAESGVVSMYSGNYKKNVTPSDRGSKLDGNPSNTKSIMSLVTKVTSTLYHPSGELLAIASDQKKDHLRLVHCTTGTVFSNWPTESTPLRKVTSMAFSPGGAYFAIGNNKGKVSLYRLKHYSNA